MREIQLTFYFLLLNVNFDKYALIQESYCLGNTAESIEGKKVELLLNWSPGLCWGLAWAETPCFCGKILFLLGFLEKPVTK